MYELFPVDRVTLIACCLAGLALALAPGPGQALVVARTIEGGIRAGWMTALGLEVGTIIHTLGAALGLSAILATSATLFSTVKYMGALYLIVLGLLALQRAHKLLSVNGQFSPGNSGLFMNQARLKLTLIPGMPHDWSNAADQARVRSFITEWLN